MAHLPIAAFLPPDLRLDWEICAQRTQKRVMTMDNAAFRRLPTEKMTLAAVAVLLALTASSAGQSAPDTENGRYTLAPSGDGFLRLDTRSGAASICTDKGQGWICQIMPDERAALDAEIGRLTRDLDKIKAEQQALQREADELRKANETLKSQLASRDGPATGKTEEALPKGDSLRKPEIKSTDGERKLEIPLPSDRELDKWMAYVEHAWRKLVDLASRLQKDTSGDKI